MRATTDRDRHLCGVLAQARWLTTAQLWRLCFPGRHRRNFERRMRALLTGTRSLPALVQKHAWVTRDGVQAVWGLTTAGYAEASLLLDEEQTPPPKAFEPETMAHHALLTELYAGLLAAPLERALGQLQRGPRLSRQKALQGLYARAFHRAWRWTVVGDGVALPWRQYESGKNRERERVLRPDAVLDLVEPRRRLFVECETGLNTVVPRQADTKPNSTLSKLQRWEAYVAEGPDAHGRRTWYQARYPDGFAPEVLFLVHSEKRAVTVAAAIDEWQRTTAGARLVARAATLSTVLAELGAAPVAPPASTRDSGWFSKQVGVGTASPMVVTAAEAQMLAAFMRRMREGLTAQDRAKGARVERPEGYEAMKALAMRLSTG